jgi:hypothetical protein
MKRKGISAWYLSRDRITGASTVTRVTCPDASEPSDGYVRLLHSLIILVE